MESKSEVGMAELRPHAVAFPTAGALRRPPIFARVRGEVCPLPGDTGLTFGRFTGAEPGATDARTPAKPLSGPLARPPV